MSIGCLLCAHGHDNYLWKTKEGAGRPHMRYKTLMAKISCFYVFYLAKLAIFRFSHLCQQNAIKLPTCSFYKRKYEQEHPFFADPPSRFVNRPQFLTITKGNEYRLSAKRCSGLPAVGTVGVWTWWACLVTDAPVTVATALSPSNDGRPVTGGAPPSAAFTTPSPQEIKNTDRSRYRLSAGMAKGSGDPKT